MGFLHKLWDETLAGPTPESGLGKLRKYNSFSGNRSAADPQPAVVASDDHRVQISRSITVIQNNNASPANRNLNVSVDSPSASSSPASCSTPTSPFSPSSPGGGNFKKLTRRRSAAVDPKSPHGYDWIILSGLDR